MKKGYENEKAKLKARFESATSCEEMFKSICKMTRSGLFDENELGLEYYKLSVKCVQQGHDPRYFTFLVSSGGTTGTEAELKKAFYAATSADEMLRAFRNLEPHVNEENLGMECLALAEKLFDEANDWENVLSYAERAFKYFISREHITGSNRLALMVAKTTLMMGSACRELGRFGDSLSYLNQCLTNTSKLESEATFPAEVVLNQLNDVHSELATLNTCLGRRNEAVLHVKKLLEIQRKRRPEGCVEVGQGNNVVADLYLEVGDFKEAFPFLLKTVEIYGAKRLMNDPEKLVLLRTSLGMMYCGMKEYGKALDHIGSSVSGLKLVEEMESANMLLVLGKFDEGEGAMKAVISRAIAQGADFTRASASVALARALCHKAKFSDANKYLKIAQRILETKQINPMVMATVLENSTKMYKEMEKIETNGDVKSCDQEILRMLAAFGFHADGTIGGVVKEMRDRASGRDSL